MVSVNKLLLFLWTFLLLSFRPSLIAQSYNKLVFALFLLVTILFGLVDSQNKGRFTIKKKELELLTVLFVTFAYFLIQGLFLSSNISAVVNSCVVLLGTVPCMFYVIRRPDNKSEVIKHIINIHFVLSISQIITFLWFTFTGFKLYELPILFDLQEVAKYYFGSNPSNIHQVVFPFTIIWSNSLFAGIEFYRTCGMYREPGMAQIFYLTAFFLSFFYTGKHSVLKRVVILIGSLLLISASGFINLVLGFILFFLFNKIRSSVVSKKVALQLSIGFIVLLCFSFFTVQIVERKFKVESGFERLVNVKKSLASLSVNPIFGDGYYNGFKTSAEGLVTSEVFLSFIGVLNQLGLLGTFLYALCWLVSLYFFSNKYSFFIYLPCLFTLITSQPSYNDVFVWFLMLLDTSQFYYPDQHAPLYRNSRL